MELDRSFTGSIKLDREIHSVRDVPFNGPIPAYTCSVDPYFSMIPAEFGLLVRHDHKKGGFANISTLVKEPPIIKLKIDGTQEVDDRGAVYLPAYGATPALAAAKAFVKLLAYQRGELWE